MPRASHADAPSGIRHEVELFGPSGGRVFAARFLPPEPHHAAVLVCPPVLAELPKNYRREVLLGRALAGRGLAVQRFHYRGSGHSEGDSALLTLDTMVADAGAAAERLMQASGAGCLGFVGTRLGALVAAAAARAWPGSPLALWDPALGGGAYLEEVLAVVGAAVTTGPVDVLGYAVEAEFRRSLRDRHLQREADGGEGPVLVVELGSPEAPRPELEQVVGRWRGQGRQVTTASAPAQQGWWRTDDPRLKDSYLLEGSPLIGLTADWLAEQLRPRDEGGSR